MVGCDECNPDWNTVKMSKLFFLSPVPQFSLLVPLVNHHRIYPSMAAYSPPSQPFMISL